MKRHYMLFELLKSASVEIDAESPEDAQNKARDLTGCVWFNERGDRLMIQVDTKEPVTVYYVEGED